MVVTDEFREKYLNFLKYKKTQKYSNLDICCIYCIKNKYNGKIYIGRSIYNVEERFEQHVRKAEDVKSDVYTTPLSSDIRMFGKNAFELSYIDCIIIRKKEFTIANDLEQKYIKELNSLFPEGYNISGLIGTKLKEWRGMNG